MVSVFRATPGTHEPSAVSYIAHSDRKIKPSVLCNVFLEVGAYLIGKNKSGYLCYLNVIQP